MIPTADRTKATVQVKVTILDKDQNLKPEMSAKVTFLEREQKAAEGAPAAPVVSVPAEAVVTRDGKHGRLRGARGRGASCAHDRGRARAPGPGTR